MAFCPQCGATLQAGARYCGSCGTATVQPTLPARAPVQPAPPAAAPTATGAAKDTGLAELLILGGALLAAALGVLGALAIMFFGGFFAFIPFWGAFPATMFAMMALVVLVASILMGWAGVHARDLVRRGEREKGGILAVALGLVSFATMNPFSGVALVVGGMLAWTAK